MHGKSARIDALLKQACFSWKLEEVKLRQEKEVPELNILSEPQMEYNYRIVLKGEHAYNQLVEQMQLIPNIIDLRINVDRTPA